MKGQEFDYIVVGAGSAGCVLASRLSEDPAHRVLLVEAGGTDRRLWNQIPLGVGKVINNPNCLWQASAGPEPFLDGRKIAWSSGRMLGGGSSVNGMLAVRGNPAYYDHWQNQGCPGMGYDDMLPYLKKLENCQFSASRNRGQNGPIGISFIEEEPVGGAFIDACKQVGLLRLHDYNSEFGEGSTLMQASIVNGRRMSTSRAYLTSAKQRSNITIMKNVIVRRVLIDESRAQGVELIVNGHAQMYYANAEVILAAGAIRSPQLLELSGVGSSKVLEKAGVKTIHELPGVGENLQDHYMVRVCFKINQPLTIYDFLNSNTYKAKELFKYLTARRGMFACGSLTAMAFDKSDRSLTYPDIRLQVGLSSGAQRVSKNAGSGLDPFSAFHIGGYYVHPHSRGSLHIQSSDPKQQPTIIANYLQADQDRKVTLQILKRIREISSQPSLAALIEEEIRPGPAITSNESLLEYAKATGDTCWHPLGSCRMGTDAMSVVDGKFRVQGLNGLRIVDASVAPFQISSNTNIPTIAIAEKAASVIRND